MATGSPLQQHPQRRSLRPARAALCLSVAFTLGWTIHAFVMMDRAIADSGVYEPFFSPNGGARDAIQAQIDQAQNEILIALYYFTDPILADALIAAEKRGVAVQVILDRTQKSGRYSQANRLSNADIQIQFDSQHRILHHKFMVVDNRVVVTGSQNWTKSAERINAENTLIVRDRAIVHDYREEFFRLLKLSQEISVIPTDAVVTAVSTAGDVDLLKLPVIATPWNAFRSTIVWYVPPRNQRLGRPLLLGTAA